MTEAETSRRRLTASTLGALVIIMVCFLIVGYVIVSIRETSRENAKSRIALCEIRADHKRDLARTNALLDEYPGDIFGIPRSFIIAGRNDDQKTIDALRILTCPERKE